MRSRTACLVAMTVALGFLSACSESRSSSPETVGSDSAESVTVPPTAPPTTIAPTTLAPTTTVAPRAFLRSDGFGDFDFGARYADMLIEVPLVVADDDGFSFPVAHSIAGYFDSADSSMFFHFPNARKVCWDDGVGGNLCAFFGGVDDASLVFVGWEYGSAAGLGTLYSASGATANILVSAVPAIVIDEGGCYSDIGGVVDGIGLGMSTNTDEIFGNFESGTGVWIPTVPVPANATVYLMGVGDVFYYEGPDC